MARACGGVGDVAPTLATLFVQVHHRSAATGAQTLHIGRSAKAGALVQRLQCSPSREDSKAVEQGGASAPSRVDQDESRDFASAHLLVSSQIHNDESALHECATTPYTHMSGRRILAVTKGYNTILLFDAGCPVATEVQTMGGQVLLYPTDRLPHPRFRDQVVRCICDGFGRRLVACWPREKHNDNFTCQ